MKKKVRNLNNLKKNSGFTLIELLVSVAIFALICSPLIHAFITAQQTSRKSHYLGDATLAARNVIETIKARGAEDIINRLNADTAPFASAEFDIHTHEPDDGLYIFDLYGYSAGMSRFDLRVTLNTEEFNEINSTKITDYSPMAAVFAQPTNPSENPDILAARYLADREIIDNSEFCNCNEFVPCTCWEKMRGLYNRVIRVTVEQNDSDVRITANYTYDFNSFIFEWRQEFYRGRICTDTCTNRNCVRCVNQSVYMCYQPKYGIGVIDNIEIDNTVGMNLTVFVVKQHPILDLEPGYNALIEQIGENIRVFSNFNVNMSNENLLPVGNCTLRITVDDVSTDITSHDILTGELVSRSQQDRMYAITVHVFERGELAGGGRHMLRVEASQMD
ncbi:MAG: type II secretion system GspH family protein [Oscillospiraceae bacterium]|nr:type II secretion system GspH family protein [Oscillospiraceae bacterium]